VSRLFPDHFQPVHLNSGIEDGACGEFSDEFLTVRRAGLLTRTENVARCSKEEKEHGGSAS
jgi:hypothetical protein